jgi:hypothetical protein
MRVQIDRQTVAVDTTGLTACCMVKQKAIFWINGHACMQTDKQSM